MARWGYGKYESDNLDTLKRLLTVYCKGVAKKKLVKAITAVAENMVKAIDGDRFAIPSYTGNLHDSTGVAVYADGMLTKYIPTKTARKPQSCGLNGYVYPIWGDQYIQAAMDEASSSFSTGIWIVLFSTVPYAYHIDANGSPIGRGRNFFGLAAQEMVNQVFMGLQPIAKKGVSASGALTESAV